MIKITPTNIPIILQKNQFDWTIALINTIREYGSYSAIPEKIKNEVINHYRHNDIKQSVKDITKSKCVFCESLIEIIDYPNIEHFYPKSVHPKFAFKWSNLLPSCRRCNIPKDNFDTKRNPFIHPVNNDPCHYLTYRDLKVYALNDNIEAMNTILKCDLNRTDLMRTRSHLLISFYDTENQLDKSNIVYKRLTQKAAKLKHADNVLKSLMNLHSISDYYSAYAGFLRHFITSSNIINQSLDLVNDNFIDLGLTKKFEFVWK